MGSGRGWCGCCLISTFYLWVASLCETYYLWSWAVEPSYTCQHEPLGGNNSGMQVLIYGLAKSGTKSMSKYLAKVGIHNSYHSEDFANHVWDPLSQSFWRRPENGGMKYPFLTTTGPPAKMGCFLDPHSSTADLKVLAGTRPEELAAAISKCRAGALAFDGYESLFWPIYNVSPNAKVIVLNWRTYAQYDKSRNDFGIALNIALVFLGFLLNGQHFLPWGYITLPVLDYINGYPIKHWMETGGPPSSTESAMTKLVRCQMNARRVMSHWFSGLGNEGHGRGSTEEGYKAFWEEGYERIPAENRFDFDMKKHGYADLCRFLNIKDRPECLEEGPRPKSGTDVLNHERENPKEFMMTIPYYLILHLVN